MKSNNFKQMTGFQSIFSRVLVVLCFLLSPHFIQAETENEVTATWLSNITGETVKAGLEPSNSINSIDIDKSNLKDYLQDDFTFTSNCVIGDKLSIVNSFVTEGQVDDVVTGYDTYFLELESNEKLDSTDTSINIEYITFSISPSNLKGNKFVPTKISFDAFRNGTDSGCIEVYLKDGNGETLVAALRSSSSSINEDTYTKQGIPVYHLYRNYHIITGTNSDPTDYDKNTYEAFSLNVSNYSIGPNESFSVVLKVVDLGNEKYIGLRNVSITGTIEQVRPYFTEYNDEYVGKSKVLHKEAKWYQENIRKQEDFRFRDNFDDDNPMVALANDTQIQAAHVYTDTIYMIKGTSLDIVIPNTKQNSSGSDNAASCSVNNYFRWFNYFDDTNYYLGEGVTVGDDNREDLLLPAYNTDTNNAWRFDNGYISGLLSKSASNSNTNGSDTDSPINNLRKVSFYYPSTEEFEAIRAKNEGFNQGSNDYYAVACDLSIYNDFSQNDYDPGTGGIDFASEKDNNDNTIYCEPTLAGRLIYYIVGIDDDNKEEAPEDLPKEYKAYWNLLNNTDYHGGGNAGKKYYEEYEITFPSKHISDYTYELVALAKDAQSYAIPGQTTSEDQLLFEFASDDKPTGFMFYYRSSGNANYQYLSGTNRVIRFSCTTNQTKLTQPWEVENNTTATIIVTKSVGGTTYNIARFKLTFKDECIPLTEPQVAALSDTEAEGFEKYWWNGMTYRSKEYLAENYDLISSLNFDYGTYDDESANSHTVFSKSSTSSDPGPGQYKNYPFPLKWNNSSYAFYDGSWDVTYRSSYQYSGYRNQTSFCMYEIVNDYVGYGELLSQINPNKPQHTGLVKNSDGCWLYVDASDRPGTIAELNFDQNLCPGSEVVVTAWMKSSGVSGNDDAAITLTIMGVKAENGIETHTPIYRQSSGQIRTTSLIEEFLPQEADLSSDVTGKGEGTNEWFQIYMSFINSDEVDFDYYTVRIDNCCASTSGGDFYLDEINVYVKHSSVQVTEINPVCTESDDPASIRIDFDYKSIMSYLGKNEETYNTEENKDDETKEYIDFIVFNRAIYNSLTDNGTSNNETTIKNALNESIVALYNTSEYNSSANVSTLGFYLYYETNTEYSSTGINYPTDGNLFRRTTSEDMLLSADYSGYFSLNTPYRILTLFRTQSETTANSLDDFASYLANYSSCTIMSDFYIAAVTKVTMNGEVVDPTLTVCVGQEVQIIPTGTYTAEVDDGNSGKESVVRTIKNEYFDWFIGTENEYITQNTDYDCSLKDALVNFRLDYPDAESLEDDYSDYDPVPTYFTENDYKILKSYVDDDKIVLHTQYLNISATADGIVLIIQPIPLSVDDEDLVESTLCFGYVPLVIEADGYAPTLMAGFGDITYPDGFTPSLRIGLKQINAANAKDKTLAINLTGATYVTNNDSNAPDHLGTVDSDDTYLKLYLVDTDDPAYDDSFGSDFSQYDLPIATLVSLYAVESNSNDNLMQIYFDTDNYNFHEGYHYYMTVFFEEKDGKGNTIENVCFGTFVLEMKVVPEYLVWQGTAGTENWNNDSMWKRASSEELKKSTGDSYQDNSDSQTDNGFVPMLFSNVIIPENQKVQLYMAGFSNNDESTTWSDGTIPSGMDSPSQNVMYDLMTYGSGSDSNTAPFTTKYYRVNLCNQIHLSTGAQLLHSELLLYQKAHVEVSVPQSQWTLVSLPLKDIVAGDWYIKGEKTKEESELFSDLKFSSDNDSRYNPLVYQRSWNSEDAVIVIENDKNAEVPSYASTGWSSVYNDTYSSFAAGSGYSIKAYTQGGSSSGSSLVFRFPKADTSYDYSSGSLSRTNAGKLLVSDLVTRNITDGYAQDTSTKGVYNESGITVNVTPTTEGYCLIGNPFTAPMSMNKFLEGNTSSLKSQYSDAYGYSGGSNDKIDLSFTSEGTEDHLLPPYEAVFVQTTDATNATINYTEDMQTFDTSSANNMVAFSVRAENANGKSSAAFAYSDTASDGYDANEDVILLKDESLQNSSMPLVYTVAGYKAVSINTLNSQTTIPLGVFVDDNSTYTLTFVGVDNVVEPTLYDAQTNTKTSITEGYSIEIAGATHGRYYINSLGKTSTGIVETAEQSYGMNAYSPSRRTVTVSSNAELRTIEIYSVNGTLQKRVNVTDNSYAITIPGVDSGIAIIRALTDEGTFVRKIGVK